MRKKHAQFHPPHELDSEGQPYMRTPSFTLRPQTVKLISKIISPLMDTGILNNKEYDTIVMNLAYIAKYGKQMPTIIPKLISGKDAASLLSISYSQFRILEKEGAFPFRRCMVGSKTVRYKNVDIINYMDVCSVTGNEAIESVVNNDDSDSRDTDFE